MLFDVQVPRQSTDLAMGIIALRPSLPRMPVAMHEKNVHVY